MIFNEYGFVGSLVGTYLDLLDLMGLAARGEVTLHTERYPRRDIDEAIADLEEGRIQGWAIIVPEGAEG